METSLSSKPKFTFLLLVVLAFTLCSIYFRQTVEYIEPGSGSDGYFYLSWARDIVRGNLLGKEIFYGLPAYPYFLSLAYLFSGGETFGLILIQILIGSLNCGLIYILGRRLFNNQVGIISSVIACTYSMFIFYNRMLLPTSLSIFLGLSLALLLLKIRAQPSPGRWVGAGFLLGLCTLARASFFLVFIFILPWIIYEYKKRSFKQLVLYFSCFILSFSLLIGGVTLRNYLVAHDPVLISAHSGINFYIGNNPRANGLFKVPPYMRATQSGLMEDARIIAERISGRRLKSGEVSNFWFRRSFSFIRSYPLNYLKLLGRKFFLFWNAREYVDEVAYYIYKEEASLFKLPLFRFSLVLPLALMGMFLSRPQAKRIMLLYLFVFALSMATIILFINSRYRIIVVPYLIIFAGFGLWRIVAMCRSRQYKNFAFSLFLFFFLYLLTNIEPTNTSLSNFSFYYNKGVYLTDRGQYKEAQEAFQAVLELNPFDFMSYLGLGNLYYKQKELTEAIDNFEVALAINPYFYKAHFNLGIIYKEMGQREQAQEEFKKVLEFNPEDCGAHYNLGRIYQEEGRTDAALKEYERALESEPAHPEVLGAIEEIASGSNLKRR